MKYGMISTGSKEASEAALEILKCGGNAFDASIAAVTTSMTSEVNLTSMAGGGALLAYVKGNQPILFDFFVDAPSPKPDRNIEFYRKDVDFFHPTNVGNLSSGYDSSIPCTPLGCSLLLKKVEKNLSGKHAVVIGRSNLNGKPMTQLLLKENCTVTITHSKTKDLKAECLRADIIIAAVGIPKLVKGDWVKKGAIVIDVGINKTDTGIVGDVDFEEVSKVAKAITPVPGGVGPMTIACLLSNTVECFKKAHYK